MAKIVKSELYERLDKEAFGYTEIDEWSPGLVSHQPSLSRFKWLVVAGAVGLSVGLSVYLVLAVR